MGLSRSTFYDEPPIAASLDEVVKRISAICDVKSLATATPFSRPIATPWAA
jgi:hypothetical protein